MVKKLPTFRLLSSRVTPIRRDVAISTDLAGRSRRLLRSNLRPRNDSSSVLKVKPTNTFEVSKKRYFRQTPPEKEKLVLELVLRHPEYSSHKISQALGVNHKGKLILGNHGVQNVLRRLKLSTYKDRLVYKKAHSKVENPRLWLNHQNLSPQQRMEMVRSVTEGKEKVVDVCRKLGVSRVIFYRWLRRYREAPKGLETQALNNKERKIERYWRQVEPEWEKRILELVLEHPEWSVPKINVALRRFAPQGKPFEKPVVGYYGVQRVLERNNLNTYQRRLTYRESLRPTVVPTPAPVPAPAVTQPPKIWRFLKAPFATVPKVVRSPRTFLLTLFFTSISVFILYRWILMLAQAPSGTQVGLIFATFALTFGFFFFIYSLKYYFTLILILGFSRQVSGGQMTENGRQKTVNGENGNGKKTIWQRIFGGSSSWRSAKGGPIESHGNPVNGGDSIAEFTLSTTNVLQNDNKTRGGLQPDLSHVELERRPFVSIHLPLYNERRVVERLLTAVTSQEYPHYEVIVADDSTDETTEILNDFARRWNENSSSRGSTSSGSASWRAEVEPLRGPVVKVIHRETREGYKGGALREALKACDPRTEFVLVFDADFLPYPDTITQFLKYFQETAGGLSFGEEKLSSVIARSKTTKQSQEIATPLDKLGARNDNGSNVAAIQGYQWHVLNKSENWITRGVRSEYAGSYVVERSGEEALGALKQIAGSVYMIRKDILDKYSWGTSITEDFELTLRLYRDGYKVVYTPYIQTPSECVSTLKRLIRQRMRWAEGHSHNIKRMFGELLFGRWITPPSDNFQPHSQIQPSVMRIKTNEKARMDANQDIRMNSQNSNSPINSHIWVPSKLTFMEKLEFLYLSPYYLQALFFMVGTLSWFISEAVFHTKLPFWTAIWGWSLVFTNLFSLPLMNLVGLFLEESEERDYGGILSFIILTYIVTPFQGYAALKGFLEKEEGPWFRTPKTGRITDIFTPGRFARLISAIFPGRRVGTQGIATRVQGLGIFNFLNPKPYTLNPLLNLRVSRKKVRGLANFVIVGLILISIALTYVSFPLTPTLAYTGTFYFKDAGAADISDLSAAGRKQMTTTTPADTTQSFTLGQAAGSASTYYAQDTAASSLTAPTKVTVTSSELATPAEYGSQRQLFRDVNGNLIAVFIDSNADINVAYMNASSTPWNSASPAWSTYAGSGFPIAATAVNLTGGLDSSGDLHVVWEDSASAPNDIIWSFIDITRTSGVIDSSGWSITSTATIDQGMTNGNLRRPSMVIDTNNYPAVCWSRPTTGNAKSSNVQFSRWNGSAWTCATGGSPACQTTDACSGGGCDLIRGNLSKDVEMHCAMGRMPDADGANTDDDALYVFAMDGSTSDLYGYIATTNGANDYNAFPASGSPTVTLATTVGADTVAAPFDLSVSPALNYGQDALSGLLVAFKESAQNTTSLSRVSLKDRTETSLSSGNAFSIGGLSLVASSSATPNGSINTEYQSDIYLFYKNATSTTAGDIGYYKFSKAAAWDSGNTFDDSSGNTDNYPIVKDVTPAGASANTYNDGGRLDAVFYDGDSVESNYAPVPYKSLTTSAGSSTIQKKMGYNGWDDLHFLTDTFSANTYVGTSNWTLRACYASGALSDVVRARWEVVSSAGTAPCSSGGECGSWVTMTKAGAGAECVQNTSVSPPSTITNLNGYRLKLRLNYDNDGTDTAPVVYANTSGQTADTLVTGYFGDPADTFYILTDNLNKKWSADTELPTEGTTSEQRNVDIATITSGAEAGNTFAVWEDERNSQGLGTWTTAGTMTYARASHAATLLQNGKVLLTGETYTLGNGGQSIGEIYDPVSNAWSTTSPSANGHGFHTATLLTNGKVLVVGDDQAFANGQSIPELYDPATQTWSTTVVTTYTRYNHSATLLPNGKVLVVGTSYGDGGQSIAEIYDPSTSTFSTTAPSTYSRGGNKATLLSSGKVLVIGGGSGASRTIAEIYDPSSETWSITGAMTYIRSSHTATLLGNGKVLAVGTNQSNAGQSIAELYDPSTNTWTTTVPSTYTRRDHTATLLSNGKILMIGTQFTDGGQSIAELYDPTTQTFSTTGPSTYARYNHAATLLNNGKVLAVGMQVIAGGQSIAEIYTPKTADIYMAKYAPDGTRASGWASDVKVNSDDGNRGTTSPYPSNYDHLNPRVKVDSSGNPIIVWQEARNSVYGDDIWAQKISTTGEKLWPASATGTWATTGNMTYARSYYTATLLNNGKTLLAGTYLGNGGQSIAELYDPSTNTFTTTAPATYGRYYHTATLLSNGKVLVVGTAWINGGQSIAELYDPSTSTFSTTAPATYGRYYHTATLLSNGKVLLTGTGETNGGQSIAELYDPSTSTFSTTAPATYARRDHTATLLNNGKVLVVGTLAGNGGRSIAEIYDPSTQTWATTGKSTYARNQHTATLLNNGKVLVVGTLAGNGGQSIAELYDPSTSTFSTTAASTYARYTHTATLLSNGKVLLTGTGETNGGRSIAELYDPSTSTFSTTAPSTYGRYQHTATLLNNGKILAVGTNQINGGQTIPEIYTPAGDIQVSNDGSPTNGYGLPSPEHPDMKGILGEQRNPVLAVDSSNNAVIAWEDTRFAAMQNWGLSFNYDANAWRQTNINLAASGACNGGGSFTNSCGAIPLIQNNPLRIMGQKLSASDGSRVWGDEIDLVNKNNPQDIGLASTGDFSASPAIAADGTNVVVTWESNGRKERDGETRNYDIYGQKFDLNGAFQWGGTWATTGYSTYSRSRDTATFLGSGKVLVVGTGNGGGGESIAEIYDPSTQTWTTTGPTTYVRNQHTATLLGSGKVLIVGTNLSNPNNMGRSIAELYDPATNTFTTTGNTNSQRTSHTATLLPNGKVLIAGTGTGAVAPEVYDPSTGTFTTTGAITYLRYNHAATLLQNGKVLVTGTNDANGGFSIPEIYDPATNTWTTTGVSTYARSSHAATLLQNGKVLVVGTSQTNGGQSIAELYDPTTQTFSTVGNTFNIRNNHTATLLSSGKVLVVGAGSGSGQGTPEIYDPQTQTWSTLAVLSVIRSEHNAILLSNGKVLIVGSSAANGTTPEIFSLDQMISSGVDLADQRSPDVAVDSGSNYIFAWQGRRGSGSGGGSSNGDSERGGGSWKIYGQKTDGSTGSPQWPNGTAGSWATIAPLTYARNYSTATLLSNGKALVVGTATDNGGASIAELYDPSVSTFSTTGAMTYARYQNTATLLGNGRVLVVGAYQSSGGKSIAELYDPSTSTFSTTAPSTYARSLHTATLLSNGKALVIGTADTNGGQSIAELYDPVTNTFSTVGKMANARYWHTTTPLNNGKVLVAGGGQFGLSQAELFDPSTNTFSNVGNMTYSRESHTATLLNNGKVLVAGGHYYSGGDIYLSQAELYDPSTNTFTTTGVSTYAYNQVASLLGNGKVLVASGSALAVDCNKAELYDPSSQTFSTTGSMAYIRCSPSAALLSNGKVLVVGTSQNNSGRSIAELYTPEKSEMMMSHDFGMKGDQERPRMAVDGTTIYGVWEDNRSAISTTLTSDKNIFMQKYNANGEPQWPVAATSTTAPFAVMDIRTDTYRSPTEGSDGWGTHYSGKPAIGGVYTGASSDKPFVVAWEDNRNSGDPKDIYAQSYDTMEQDISQTTAWNVYFDVNQVATLAVNVGIVEWDGTTYLEKGQGTSQTWNTCSPACPSEQSLTWTSGGSPAPPSDQIGNITMRRLIVTFTRTTGSVTIYYDDATDSGGVCTDSSGNCNSRLSTGDIVPEKVLFLGLIIPFLPPAIAWYNRRRKRVNMRMVCECK